MKSTFSAFHRRNSHVFKASIFRISTIYCRMSLLTFFTRNFGHSFRNNNSVIYVRIVPINDNLFEQSTSNLRIPIRNNIFEPIFAFIIINVTIFETINVSIFVYNPFGKFASQIIMLLFLVI